MTTTHVVKRQSLSTTIVLFRTTFTRTIKLNLHYYYYYYYYYYYSEISLDLMIYRDIALYYSLY